MFVIYAIRLGPIQADFYLYLPDCFLFVLYSFIKGASKAHQRHLESVSHQSRILMHPIYTLYISRDFKSSRTYTKKAGPQYCCSACWGSGVAFLPKQQHWAHAICIWYTHNGARIQLYTTWASCVAMFWVIIEIYQISTSQNKARKTLSLVICHRFFTLSVPAIWIAQFKTAAKVVLFFDMCK